MTTAKQPPDRVTRAPTAPGPDPTTWHHVEALSRALPHLTAEGSRFARWGSRLSAVLGGGGRVLVAGNGGSAAEAQHLTAELVGKLRDDRRPLSAIALHADTSSVTAIGNDYGYDQVFSRQVRAHGRRGDILVLLSTSGKSANVLAAAHTARALGLTTWAVTGPRPNPLAMVCDDTLAAVADDPQTVQEMHLVAVHVLCAHVDATLPATSGDRHGC